MVTGHSLWQPLPSGALSRDLPYFLLYLRHLNDKKAPASCNNKNSKQSFYMCWVYTFSSCTCRFTYLSFFVLGVCAREWWVSRGWSIHLSITRHLDNTWVFRGPQTTTSCLQCLTITNMFWSSRYQWLALHWICSADTTEHFKRTVTLTQRTSNINWAHSSSPKDEDVPFLISNTAGHDIKLYTRETTLSFCQGITIFFFISQTSECCKVFFFFLPASISVRKINRV